jgi:hypothetical protein
MRRILVLAASLIFMPLLDGCSRFEPDGAVLIEPPAEYALWWARTEECSGLTKSLHKVEFYSVPGSSFPCPGGKCVGRWEDNHHIYIAEAWLGQEMVVRHEMLHELIGHAGHPNPPFPAPCHLTWASWNGAPGLRGRGDMEPGLD